MNSEFRHEHDDPPLDITLVEGNETKIVIKMIEKKMIISSWERWIDDDAIQHRAISTIKTCQRAPAALRMRMPQTCFSATFHTPFSSRRTCFQCRATLTNISFDDKWVFEIWHIIYISNQKKFNFSFRILINKIRKFNKNTVFISSHFTNCNSNANSRCCCSESRGLAKYVFKSI